jgi:hypothetical protein
MIGIKLVLLICALVSMGLSAFSVPTGRINTMTLSFAFLIATLLV